MHWNFAKRLKERLQRCFLITLYDSFAYPYLNYCNQVWGNNYPTVIYKLVFMQKKLVRIITCSQTSPYWTIDACHQNVISDFNRYLTDTFVDQCIHKKAHEMFINLFHTNSNFHDHGTRHSEDPHVPYGRIDVRQFSIKIHCKLWNSIPDQIKSTQFIYMIKQQFRNYLIESWVFCHNYFKYVNYVHILYDCAYRWIMYCVGFMLISCI